MTKIAIIGGGIGGLAVANTLQKKSIPFHLFERASAFGEVGAAIGIGGNAFELLKRMGLGDEISRKARAIRQAVIADKKLNTIKKIPAENVGYCIYRPDLISVLSGGIDPQQVSLAHEIKNINTNGKQILLEFENGKKEEFDTVIACDGINSVVRKKIFPNIQKRYSGQTIWRGIAECSLPDQFADTYYELWGENLRFAIIPLAEKRFYWYAVKWARAGEKDNRATIKADLQKLFSGYTEIVNRVIEHTPEFLRDDMHDLEPGSRPWYHNNIVFLGDAIHATTPNLAQGGCQAIEDAYALAEAFHHLGINEKAFQKYTQLRSKKANYIVEQSWKLGRMSHQSNKVSEALTAFIFRHLVPDCVFIKQYQIITDLDYLDAFEK